MGKGIALAGNIMVDTIKNIDMLPERFSLANIKSVKRSLGGSVNNVGFDLARLDPSLPIKAIGYIGDDENGDYVLEQWKRYPSLNTDLVKRAGINSFTDVLTEPTGERTFLTYKGADNLLTDQDFDFSTLDVDILHIGYILLLDKMDAADETYGTVMAKTMCFAQNAGILTSVDVVSENSDRFKALVPPALKYADFCTINEFEAQRATGILLRDPQTNKLLCENMEKACLVLKNYGVRRWVTIHAAEGAFGIDENDAYTQMNSLPLPRNRIKGTVGAGDAFAAGILYEAYQGATHEKAICTANAVAALSLCDPTASDGILPYEQVLDFAEQLLKEESV